MEKLHNDWYKPLNLTVHWKSYNYPTVTLKMLERGLDLYKKKLTITDKVEDVKQNLI